MPDRETLDVAARHDLAAMLDVGRQLAAAREQRELTQGERGRRARVQQASISRIEGGLVLPTLPTLSALLAAMDLQPLVTFAPRWADVDALLARWRGVTVEERCSEWEADVVAIADLALQHPIALGGELAAMLHGVPSRRATYASTSPTTWARPAGCTPGSTADSRATCAPA